MCKKLIQGLFGGGDKPRAAPQPARPIENVDRTGEADVKNSDIVDTSDVLAGREASGRVRLSGGKKRSNTSVGLSL